MMLKRLGGIFEKARQIETAIAARVETTAERVSSAPAVREPLELLQAVVDAVAREIRPMGRGTRGFPFNHVKVVLLAPTPRVKAHLQALLDGPQSLEQRIDARLRAAGCQMSPIAIGVTFVTKPREDWPEPDYSVEYSRVTDVPPASSSLPSIGLVIVSGAGPQASYLFSTPLVALGRGVEVTDRLGRLIRTNHVVFTEGDDEVNQTVSRKHARIERDAVSGVFRVYDEGSAQGTSIIRAGRGHVVPRGTRGMTLESGDELVLGRARVTVDISR